MDQVGKIEMSIKPVNNVCAEESSAQCVPWSCSLQSMPTDSATPIPTLFHPQPLEKSLSQFLGPSYHHVTLQVGTCLQANVQALEVKKFLAISSLP